MKLAIVGSREFTDLEAVESFVRCRDADCCIVSGGAMGVDRAAVAEARRIGLETVVIKPDYKRHGDRAPLIRNDQIVAEADRVVAFWDMKSRGTAYTMKKAIDAGKLWRVNP